MNYQKNNETDPKRRIPHITTSGEMLGARLLDEMRRVFEPITTIQIRRYEEINLRWRSEIAGRTLYCRRGPSWPPVDLDNWLATKLGRPIGGPLNWLPMVVAGGDVWRKVVFHVRRDRDIIWQGREEWCREGKWIWELVATELPPSKQVATSTTSTRKTSNRSRSRSNIDDSRNHQQDHHQKQRQRRGISTDRRSMGYRAMDWLQRASLSWIRLLANGFATAAMRLRYLRPHQA